MKSEIRRLLNEAWGLPHGFAEIDMLKEAVRLADVSNDLELQYETRDRYLTATVFGGKGVDAIVVFTWMLNHFDEVEGASEYSLLWAYKWILDIVVTVPDFSIEQIEYFFTDARNRYQRYSGSQSRPLDFLEAHFATQKGDRVRAIELLEQGESTRRDLLSDCAACDPAARATYWFALGEVDRAINRHEELIESRKSCTEEPIRSNASAALYYSMAGRWEDALVSHQAGYPKLKRNDHLAVKAFNGMAYKLRADRKSDALRIFDTHLGAHLRTRNKWLAFEFFLAAHLTMHRLRESGKSSVKLRSAAKLPISSDPESGKVDAAELDEWLTNEARAIAEKFDARNQSTWFQDRLKMEWPFGVWPD